MARRRPDARTRYLRAVEEAHVTVDPREERTSADEDRHRVLGPAGEPPRPLVEYTVVHVEHLHQAHGKAPDLAAAHEPAAGVAGAETVVLLGLCADVPLGGPRASLHPQPVRAVARLLDAQAVRLPGGVVGTRLAVPHDAERRHVARHVAPVRPRLGRQSDDVHVGGQREVAVHSDERHVVARPAGVSRVSVDAETAECLRGVGRELIQHFLLVLSTRVHEDVRHLP